MSNLAIGAEALGALLPMHLWVGPQAGIVSAGPALRRLIGEADTLSEALTPERRVELSPAGLPVPGEDGRIFMRLVAHPATILRGNAVALPDGGLLMNLGFGIGLADAVRRHNLTERDFAASDLAMELLFLHEANAAILGELSRSNLRLEEARQAAETQAFTDPLTGLYNRRGLEIALELALRGAQLGQDAGNPAGFALLHIDLDYFKEINDRYGHGAGDDMLREVARKLRAATRADDTVARIGGDEFIVILPAMIDEDRLRALGRRIIDSIETPVLLGEVYCHVSASIGVAISSRYAMPDSDRMMDDADRALYAAKGAGRGRLIIDGDSLPAPAEDQPDLPAGAIVIDDE